MITGIHFTYTRTTQASNGQQQAHAVNLATLIGRYAFCLLLVALCFVGQQVYAQSPSSYLVRGTVVDSASRKPVEFATVVVSDTEKKTVAMTYSDEKGIFQCPNVKAGSYVLTLTFVGYASREIPFRLSGASSVMDLGVISFRTVDRQLEAVTVVGQRQLVDQQPGILVYNADLDISNTGGTAADVLRKAPILNVDAAGNVTMRGNSNLRILINGKYSGQMARSAADALNMMPANTIKSVEVITSPSARYDAEGAAGVINIITKKGEQFSGNLELVGGNLEQAINPRVAFSRNKWTVNSYLHVHRLRMRKETSLDRLTLENGQPTGRLLQNNTQDNTAPHGSGDLQVEYAPDSINLLTFSMNGWLGRWPGNSDQQTQRFSPEGTSLDAYRQAGTTRAPNKGIDFNIGYTRKFKKPGEELYLMAQHTYESDKYYYDARQMNEGAQLIYREINDNVNLNKEWTLQLDYILPFSKRNQHALETGAKMILRDNSSQYSVLASDDTTPDALVPVASRTDLFTYTQDVAAAYSQLKFKWQHGWALHAGARLEGTFLEGRQHNQSSSFQNEFWNLVPSATLFKRLDAHNNLTLSYTQRISRPSIWDLNPNQNTQDPNNIEVGNPQLRPEVVHQVEFSYALQTDTDLFINASLFGRKTNNSMEDFISTNAQGVSILTKQNLASNERYGLNLSVAFSPTSRWKINGNGNVSHARFNSDALGVSNNGMAWGLNLNSSWTLPKDFTIQAYGDYEAKSIMLQGDRGDFMYYSFSAKKKIPARKLTLTLTAVSPFDNYLSQTEVTRGNDFESAVRTRYLRRSVRLSINWEFGGLFKETERRKIDNDDQKNKKGNG